MIPIFVSSTFRDMHAERDHLMLKVLPELNFFANTFGENVRLVDLRWGVDTTDLSEKADNDANRKVLQVCLNEIYKSRPYMIIMLGERYGWVPENEELILNASSDKGFTPSSLKESVTELEIEYGALLKGDLSRCLFYFREPLTDIPGECRDIYIEKNEEHRQKLDLLKQKIIDSGGNVFYYKASWNDKIKALDLETTFTTNLLKHLQSLLLEDLKKEQNLTLHQRERNSANALKNLKADQFSARDNLIEDCLQKLKQGDKQLLIIKGVSGSGKSTLLSKLATCCEETANVMFFASANSKHSQFSLDFVKRVLYDFEELLDISPSFVCDKTNAQDDKDAEEYVRKISEYAFLYNKHTDKPLYIFCDAIDQLFQDDMTKKLSFLPDTLPSNVRIVLSCLSEFEIPSIFPLKRRSDNFIVEPLNEQEKPNVVKSILSSSSKELNDGLITHLIQSSGSDNPLYLNMMLQRLIMLNSDEFGIISEFGNNMEAINKYLLQLIDNTPNEVSELSVHIFTEAGNRINGTLCCYILNLIATSRRGLRMKDLEQIVLARGEEFNELDFALFTKYMQPFFITRQDGRIDFTHKAIRQGYMNAIDLHSHNLDILNYLKTLPNSDVVKSHEIMYHLYKNDDEVGIDEYICSLEYSGNGIIATNELYVLSLSDVDWFTEYFAFLSEEKKSTFYLFIITNAYYEEFAKTRHEQSLAKIFLSNLIISTQTMLKENNTRYVKRSLSSLYYRLGMICEFISDIDESIAYFRKNVLLSKEIADEVSEIFVGAITHSYRHIAKKTVDLSTDALKKYVMEKEVLVEPYRLYPALYRDVMIAYSRLGGLLYKHGREEEGNKYIQFAKEINEQLVEAVGDNKTKRDLAISFIHEGDNLRTEEKFEKALSKYIDANEMFLSINDEMDNISIWVLSSYDCVGDMYIRLDNTKLAEEYFFKAYKIAQKMYKQLPYNMDKLDNYIDVVLCFNRIARILMEKDIKAATTIARDAVDISEILDKELKTRKSYEVSGEAYFLLSYLLSKDNINNSAIGFAMTSLELIDKSLELDFSQSKLELYVMYHVNASSILSELESYNEAASICKWAIDKLNKFDNKHGVVLSLDARIKLYSNIATAYNKKGDYSNACPYYTQIAKCFMMNAWEKSNLPDLSDGIDIIRIVLEMNKKIDRNDTVTEVERKEHKERTESMFMLAFNILEKMDSDNFAVENKPMVAQLFYFVAENELYNKRLQTAFNAIALSTEIYEDIAKKLRSEIVYFNYAKALLLFGDILIGLKKKNAAMSKYYDCINILKQIYDISTIESHKEVVRAKLLEAYDKLVVLFEASGDFESIDCLNTELSHILAMGYSIEYIFSSSNEEKPFAKDFYAMENGDGEFLFVFTNDENAPEKVPKNAILFYDGKEHAVLKAEDIKTIICVHVAEEIKQKISKIDKILFGVFSKGEDGETQLSMEFFARMIYLPTLPISKAAELYID